MQKLSSRDRYILKTLCENKHVTFVQPSMFDSFTKLVQQSTVRVSRLLSSEADVATPTRTLSHTFISQLEQMFTPESGEYFRFTEEERQSINNRANRVRFYAIEQRRKLEPSSFTEHLLSIWFNIEPDSLVDQIPESQLIVLAALHQCDPKFVCDVDMLTKIQNKQFEELNSSLLTEITGKSGKIESAIEEQLEEKKWPNDAEF